MENNSQRTTPGLNRRIRREYRRLGYKGYRIPLSAASAKLFYLICDHNHRAALVATPGAVKQTT